MLDDIEGARVVTLTNAVDADSYERAVERAARSPLIVAGFGIHPWEAPRFAADPARIDGLLADAAFIGEIGLDRRFVDDPARYPAQQRLFDHQLTAAARHRKLVNVHASGAERQVLDAIERHGVARVIIHWYAGPIDVLHDMIDAGYHFTVGAEVLVSDHIRRIAGLIPDERLLTETDNPGGPEWLTGEIEFPSVVGRVAAAIAAVRGTSPQAVNELVLANFARLVAGDPGFAELRSLLAG